MQLGLTSHALTAFISAGIAAVVAAALLPAPPAIVVVAVAVVIASVDVVLFNRVRSKARAGESPSDARLEDPPKSVSSASGADVEPRVIGQQTTPQVGLVTPAQKGSMRLSDYRGEGNRRRQPQCPTCGRFQVENSRRSQTYLFTCRSCGASWSWSVGQPWPRVLPIASIPNPSNKE